MGGMKKAGDNHPSTDDIGPRFQFFHLVTAFQHKWLLEAGHSQGQEILKRFHLPLRDYFYLRRGEAGVLNSLRNLSWIERSICLWQNDGQSRL